MKAAVTESIVGGSRLNEGRTALSSDPGVARVIVTSFDRVAQLRNPRNS